MHETITHAVANIPEIYDNLGSVKVAFFIYFLFIVLTVTTRTKPIGKKVL